MKKELTDALKAKFVGVSETILDRVATKLAKTVTTEEEVTAAVDGVTFQQVLESYGDSRATEAQQTAVRNYEQKYGLKDGKAKDGDVPLDKKEQPKTDNEEAPAWGKALLEQYKTLAERLNNIETEHASTNRRKQLSAEIAALPASLRKAYERTNIDTLTDEEFSTLLTEVKTEVEQIGNDINAKGAVFGQPNKANNKASAGNSKAASDAETDAVVGKLI